LWEPLNYFEEVKLNTDIPVHCIAIEETMFYFLLLYLIFFKFRRRAYFRTIFLEKLKFCISKEQPINLNISIKLYIKMGFRKKINIEQIRI